MRDLKEFNIQFVGLKLGKHSFQYQIDEKFFTFFNYQEFEKAAIDVEVLLTKKTTLLELEFKCKGFVNVICDVSLEPFNLNFDGSFPLIVKFGEEYNDENEEILILPHEAYQVNISQQIYELIVLSIPSKKIHPKVEDGTLETDTLKKLKELQVNKEKNTDNTTVDPRWDKLKNLITEKKT